MQLTMFKISISLQPASTPRRSNRSRGPLIAAAMGLVLLPIIATAAPVDIPNAFADGDTISAEEFNENFDAISVAVADNDSRITVVEGANTGAPTGAVMFFNLSECPEGWAELQEARGRAVVGMNGSAGTLLGEVGSGLGDLGVVSHGHAIASGSSVTTSTDSVAHTHGSGSYSTDTEPAHNHQWKDGAASYASAGNVQGLGFVPFQVGTFQAVNWGTSSDLYTSNAPAHSHDVNGSSGSSSSTSHSHTANLSGVAVGAETTSLPYLQLLACERT